MVSIIPVADGLASDVPQHTLLPFCNLQHLSLAPKQGQSGQGCGGLELINAGMFCSSCCITVTQDRGAGLNFSGLETLLGGPYRRLGNQWGLSSNLFSGVLEKADR